MGLTVEQAIDYRKAAQSLRPLIEGRVADGLARGNVVDAVIAEFHDSGLYYMQVPSSLGGGEVDCTTAFEVIEEISYADGSAGWTFMAGSASAAMMGAFLDDAAVAEIFEDPRALGAGQAGAPRGTATAAPGGYTISGSYGFGSGIAHAGWTLGGTREVDDTGKPVRLESGLPNIICCAVPTEKAELLDNWDVIGLQATGSIDYRIPEQFVREGFTWPLFTGGPLRGGGVYRIGVNGLTCIDHSAFSIGVARRALDEVATIAQSKRRAGRKTLAEDPLFQASYADAEAKLGAARAFVIECLQALESAAVEDHIEPRHRARARLATTHASRTSIEVADFAFQFSGSSGLRNGNVVQQCFRDLTASGAHVFTDHNSMIDIAASLLGTAEEGQFI